MLFRSPGAVRRSCSSRRYESSFGLRRQNGDGMPAYEERLTGADDPRPSANGLLVLHDTIKRATSVLVGSMLLAVANATAFPSATSILHASW